jgi:hypothetical protein
VLVAAGIWVTKAKMSRRPRNSELAGRSSTP